MSRPLKFKGALCATALAVLSLAAQADLARVGPRNIPSPAGHGYPLWYQDLNGLVLDLCLPNVSDPGNLQMTACLQTAPQPYTFPSLFPDESFYFRATSSLALPGGFTAVYVSALEGAFAGGPAAVNDNVVFTRLRVVAGVPEGGEYTFYHPYGIHNETVDFNTGKRDVTWTEDVGIGTPGDFTGALRSQVGPFLRAADAAGAPVAPITLNGVQFLADAVPTNVTGSPFNQNFFMVCGERFDGGGFIPLGNVLGPNGNPNCASTGTFTLTGRLHDMVAQPIGSPLAIQAATYSRDAGGTHVNVGAQVARVLATQPVPLLTAASNQTPPVRLAGPDVLDRYFAQGFTDPSGTLPGQITVTNSGDNPPTSVQAAAKDVVTIISASYNAATQTLTAIATSSDKGFATELSPVLALEGFAATSTRGGVAGDPASFTLTATGVAVPPPQVVVASTAGGIGRVDLTTDPNLVSPPGSPFARDDLATLTASGGPILIPVLANDLANVAAPIDPATLAIVAGGVQPANMGTAAVVGGQIQFTPNNLVGTATLRYTVSSAAVPGASNMGLVTVNVTPPVGGAIPVATNDTAVFVNRTSRALNVLANDLGNGGTLNPASVLVTGVTGGTAVVNADGTVTFTAGTVVGNFGFSYTVATTAGIRSNPATVAIRERAAENITSTNAQCTRSTNRWRLTATGIEPSTTVTFYNTAAIPATPSVTNTIGTFTADATGTVVVDQSGGRALCNSSMSAVTQLGSRRPAAVGSNLGLTTTIPVALK